MTDADTFSDPSDQLPAHDGHCPECGSSAVGFTYADGNYVPVQRWWPDGRPAVLIADHIDDPKFVALSREDYEAAVEAAPARSPEFPEFAGALHCSRCGEAFDRARIGEADA